MADYTLIFSQGGTTSLPVLTTHFLTVPVIAIEAKILVEGKDWVRVGWVEPVVVATIGNGTKLISGQPERVTRGFHEFRLNPPELPYQLLFMPREWVTAWELNVYERNIIPVTEPIELDSNLIYQKLLDLEAKIDAL